MRIQGRPLTNTENKQFESYTRRGMTMLGLAGNSEAEPAAIVNAVDAFVDKWQDERSNPLKNYLSKGRTQRQLLWS